MVIMKKIAVVNRTNLLNFGSVLQVLALYRAVEKLEYECDVIWEEGTISKHLDLRPTKVFSVILKLIRYPKFIKGVLADLNYVKTVTNSEFTIELFKSFVEKNIPCKYFNHRKLKEIGHSTEYHKYICGSDQIWCTTTLYPDPLMYLRFTSKGKRVAYAPSLGRDFIPEYNRNILKKYISDIPTKSVREKEGAILIKHLTGDIVPVVVDPTLLWDKNFWLSYASEIEEKDYILCYFLTEPSIDIQKEIFNYVGNKKVVILRSPLTYISEKHVTTTMPDAGPGEFISYVANADFIFTDSYHGMLFAINFEKDFLSVERDYGQFNQSTRQKSILEQLDLLEYYNTTGMPNQKKIDYLKVNKRLAELRESSISYLSDSLKK